MGPPRRAVGRAGQLRRWPAWALYLVGGAMVIMAYYLVPAVSLLPAWTPKLVLYQGLSFSAAVAILAGVQQHRPPRRRPWYLLAVSQFVYASADATFYVAHDVLHQEQFPALADLLYLSHYPILMAGLLLLVRQRTPRGDRASLIDACVIALGAGLLSWLFLIGPLASDAQRSALVKMASVAYPAADLLVFAVAVRLLVGPGTRPASYWLLSASLLVASGPARRGVAGRPGDSGHPDYSRQGRQPAGDRWRVGGVVPAGGRPPGRAGRRAAAGRRHRRADRPVQPSLLRGDARAGGRACGQVGAGPGPARPGYRPLQADQRRPRPPGRRQGAARARRPAGRLDPRR